MSATATEVRDALGQVTAVVTVLHDLTTVRELERRTVEHQLAESEKLAATVAHEINNPLEAIKNALYLLVTRTPEDDPNRAFLEIASRETERVSTIIRQMLGFYRRTPRRQPVDVNHLLREVAALLERQLRRHRVTLTLQLSSHLPPVTGSGDQLKQLVLNLFLNAQEAMPAGVRSPSPPTWRGTGSASCSCPTSGSWCRCRIRAWVSRRSINATSLSRFSPPSVSRRARASACG